MGEIGEIITGNTPSKSNEEYYGNKYPFFKPTDLDSGYFVTEAQDNLSIKGFEISRKLPIKSILVTCIGATIGKTGFIRREGTCNQQINAIIASKLIFSEYIYLLCISPYFQNEIIKNASATTLPIINKSKFEKLFLPLPPLSEQRRIVEKIEELLALVDDLETNKTDLQSYIKQAKSKVLEMAIRGKLVPQNPNDEPASVLLERIKKEQKSSKSKSKTTAHNTHYEEKLPFDIPENWAWCRLGEVCEKIETGNSINAKIKETKYKNLEEGFPYIGTKDISENHYIKYDNGIKIPFLEKFKVAKKNSILLCIEGGSAGRKIGITNRDVCFGNKLAKFYSHNISNSYILFFLMSEQFKSQFKESISGLIGGVSINKLGQFVLPLPPLAEQKRIVEKIEEIFSALEFIEENLI